MRILVTGTGRSGTNYIARVFNACGVLCGHENVFHHARKNAWKRWSDGKEWEAESSWMAVPFLDEFDGYILHLVRNPLDCIRSLASIGVFHDTNSPYHAFKKKHCPEAFEFENVWDRAACFWVKWNMRVFHQANKTVRLEELNLVHLFQVLQSTGHPTTKIRYALDKVAKTANAMPRKFDHITLDDIDQSLETELRDVSRILGYDVGALGPGAVSPSVPAKVNS